MEYSDCEVLVKHGKYDQFLVGVTKTSEASMDVDVYEVTSWGKDNETLSMELYLTAYMKWDACMHVWFGEKDDKGKSDGYLHLCGLGSWKGHIEMMEALYRFAENKIPDFDDSEKWVAE